MTPLSFYRLVFAGAGIATAVLIEVLTKGQVPGAGLATLMSISAVGEVASGTLKSMAANFFHQVSDELGAGIAKLGHSRADLLKNKELQRFIRETIAATLGSLKDHPALDAKTKRRLPVLATKVGAALETLAQQPSLDALTNERVVRLFWISADEFADATVLDQKTWSSLLGSLDDFIEKESASAKVGRVLTKPLSELMPSEPLSPAARDQIGRLLAEVMPQNFYDAAKNAWVNRDPAFASLHLSLMRELMTDTRQVLHAVESSRHETVALIGSQRQMLEQLQQLVRAVQEQSAQVANAVPEEDREGLLTALNEINRQVREVTDQLGVVQDSLVKLEQHLLDLAHKVEQVESDLGKLLLKNKILGVFIWESQFCSPATDSSGEVLYGAKADPIHLKEGYFFRRERLQTNLRAQVEQWIEDIETRTEPVTSLPVFWIEGASGAGKSIALLHLAADLKTAGHIVLWVGRQTGLMAAAVETARLLDNPPPPDCRVIIVVDDPYVPDSNPDDWRATYSRVADLLATGKQKQLPLIVCCGASDHRARFEHDFAESEMVEVLPSPVGRLDQGERRELLRWLGRRRGIEALKDADGHAGEDLPVLLIWRWSWPDAANLKEFLARFLKQRLEVTEDNQELQQFFARLLTLNRLYVEVPRRLYEDLSSGTRHKLAHLRRDLHLVELASDDSGGGLRMAHAQIANLLYQCWAGSGEFDDASRAEHLSESILVCMGSPDVRDQVAPLVGLAAALEYRRDELQLSESVVRLVVNLCWPAWEKRIRDNVGSSLSGLTTWLRIFAALNHQGIQCSSEHPIMVLCEVIEHLAGAGPQLQEMCRLLDQGWDEAPSEVQKNAADKLNTQIAKLATELSALNAGPDWFQRWRLGQELERTRIRILGGSGTFPALGRKWLLQHGTSYDAASMWERSLAVGLLDVAASELDSLSGLLEDWLSSYSEHPRWLQLWSHGARWRKHLVDCPLDDLFTKWAAIRLSTAAEKDFAPLFAHLCRWARNRRWSLGPQAMEELSERGVLWLKTNTPIVESVQIIGAVIQMNAATSRERLSQFSQFNTLVFHSEFLLKRVEVDIRYSHHWKHVWSHLVTILARTHRFRALEQLKAGWMRIKGNVHHEDWPYIAQELYEQERNGMSLSGKDREALFHQTRQWLSANSAHASWNYLFRAVLSHMRDQLRDRGDRQRLLREGVTWLEQHANSLQWNYVWQDAMQHKQLFDSKETRDMVHRALRWLRDDTEHKRQGWIFIYERVLELFNEAIRPAAENFRAPVRFELPHWFIPEGIRYVKAAPDEDGIEGAVAQLLRSGATSAELAGIQLWIDRHVFQHPGEHAWVVLQALAQRPDDLPLGISHEAVLARLIDWLRSYTDSEPKLWIVNWHVAKNLASGLGRQTELSKLHEVALVHLEQKQRFDRATFRHLFYRWSELLPDERQRVDALLTPLWKSLRKSRSSPDWWAIWTTLAHRRRLDSPPAEPTAAQLRLEAEQWLGVGSDTDFEGLPDVMWESFFLSDGREEQFLKRALIACTTLKSADEQQRLWGKTLNRVWTKVNEDVLREILAKGGHRLERIGDVYEAVHFWKRRWRARNQLRYDEGTLISVACELVNRSPNHQWLRTWEEIIKYLSSAPPALPAWDLAQLALQQQLDLKESAIVLAKVIEHRAVLVPEKSLTTLVTLVQNELPSFAGHEMWSRVATQAVELLTDAAVALDASHGNWRKQLERSFLDQFLSEASGNSDRWWETIAIAAQLASDADLVQQVQQRIRDELVSHTADPGKCVNIWYQIMCSSKTMSNIMNEKYLKELVDYGWKWLQNHRMSTGWPRMFQGLAENCAAVHPAPRRDALRKVGLERLCAMTADNVGWPHLWSGLEQWGLNDELIRVGRFRLLAGPLEMNGLSRIFLALLRALPDDRRLLNRAEGYLNLNEPTRTHYHEIAELVEDRRRGLGGDSDVGAVRN